MPRLVMLELTPEDMMKAIETMAEMLVSVKEYPNLIKAIPNDPKALVIVLLQQTIARREAMEKKQEGVTAEEDAADAEQLEQSVKAFQEAMAKAAGK